MMTARKISYTHLNLERPIISNGLDLFSLKKKKTSLPPSHSYPRHRRRP